MSLQMLFYHRVALKVRTRAEQQPDEGGCMEPPAYMGQWQANYPGMALVDATPLMDPVLQVQTESVHRPHPASQPTACQPAGSGTSA